MKVQARGTKVLVTGASSGIGESLCKLFAAQADTLYLVARRKDRLDSLKETLTQQYSSLKVESISCDLSKLEQVDQLCEQLLEQGGVDILVNNAGLGDIGLLELSEPDKLELLLSVNINALTRLTRKLLPPMVKKGSGGVLNISSGFGYTYMPGVAAYAASKHYVSCFSECLAMELSGTGVSVTQVCPGPVATEFEGVAGNPIGQPVPAFLQLSADQCAAEAYTGFLKGKSVVIPGLPMKLLIPLGSLMPRWLRRLVYGPFGPALRKKQLSSGSQQAISAP